MDQVTQRNAGTAEATAAAAEELNSQSQILRDSVGLLRQLTDGARRPVTTADDGLGNRRKGVGTANFHAKIAVRS